MSILHTESGKWAVRYHDENRTQRQHTFDTKEEAEDYDQKWLNYHAQVREQERIQSLALPSKAITLERLAEQYFDLCKKNGRSEHHIETMKYCLTAHIYKVIPPTTDITTINYESHISPFLSYLNSAKSARGGKISDATKNRYCSFLNSFFNFAVKLDYLPKNPMALWKRRKEKPKVKELTAEDLAKIIEHSPPHLA